MILWRKIPLTLHSRQMELLTDQSGFIGVCLGDELLNAIVAAVSDQQVAAGIHIQAQAGSLQG